MSIPDKKLKRKCRLLRLKDDPENLEVCYLQSQNGNVWDRYRDDQAKEEDEEDDSPELARFQEWVLKGPKVMQALGELRAEDGNVENR